MLLTSNKDQDMKAEIKLNDLDVTGALLDAQRLLEAGEIGAARLLLRQTALHIEKSNRWFGTLASVCFWMADYDHERSLFIIKNVLETAPVNPPFLPATHQQFPRPMK